MRKEGHSIEGLNLYLFQEIDNFCTIYNPVRDRAIIFWSVFFVLSVLKLMKSAIQVFIDALWTNNNRRLL